MVNRRTGSGVPYNQAEAITAQEALCAYTYGSAYASHQEDMKGSITPGKLADLVVLSDDPTAVPAPEIAGISVLATYVGGRCGYDALG
jgi:predicted amidohydrolase YtcJ